MMYFLQVLLLALLSCAVMFAFGMLLFTGLLTISIKVMVRHEERAVKENE